MRIQNGLPVQKFKVSLNSTLSSVGAKGAESGGKDRQIRRPFHLDVQILRKHHFSYVSVPLFILFLSGSTR